MDPAVAVSLGSPQLFASRTVTPAVIQSISAIDSSAMMLEPVASRWPVRMVVALKNLRARLFQLFGAAHDRGQLENSSGTLSSGHLVLSWFSRQQWLPFHLAHRAKAHFLLERIKETIPYRFLLTDLQRKRLGQAHLIVSRWGTTGSVLDSAGYPLIEINVRLVSQMTDAQLAWVLAHELGHVWKADDRIAPQELMYLPEEAADLSAHGEETGADSFGLLVARLILHNIVDKDLTELPVIWAQFEATGRLRNPTKKTEWDRLVAQFEANRNRFRRAPSDPHRPTPQRIAALCQELHQPLDESAQHLGLEWNNRPAMVPPPALNESDSLLLLPEEYRQPELAERVLQVRALLDDDAWHVLASSLHLPHVRSALLEDRVASLFSALFGGVLYATGETLPSRLADLTDFMQNVYPHRNNLTAMLAWAASRDAARPEQEAFREIASRTLSIPRDRVLFLNSEDTVLRLFFGYFRSGMTQILLENLQARPEKVILLPSSQAGFLSLRVLAHEASHWEQRPEMAFAMEHDVFSRSVYEGFQRYREYEMLLRMEKDPVDGARVRQSVESAYDELQNRVPSISFEEKVWEVLNRHVASMGYPAENQLVRELVNRAGVQAMKSYFLTGDLAELEHALGDQSLELLRNYFDHWQWEFDDRLDPLQKIVPLALAARLLRKIPTGPEELRRAATFLDILSRQFETHFLSQARPGDSFIRWFHPTILTVIDRYMSGQLDDAEFEHSLADELHSAIPSDTEQAKLAAWLPDFLSPGPRPSLDLANESASSSNAFLEKAKQLLAEMPPEMLTDTLKFIGATEPAEPLLNLLEYKPLLDLSRWREGYERVISQDRLIRAIRGRLSLPAESEADIRAFLLATETEDIQRQTRNLADKYGLVIAPFDDGMTNYGGACLYSASAAYPLRTGKVGPHTLSYMGIHEPIVVDIQSARQPWEPPASAPPSPLVESHGMHAPGSNLGIVFGKNILEDAMMIAAHLKDPQSVSPLYSRFDREEIVAKLGESHVIALEQIAGKLLARSFPDDRSVQHIAQQMMNVTAVHELAHILDSLIAGSYHSTNREEMAARLQEAISGGNPFLALYMLANVGAMAPKDYAIDSLKMLDAVYEIAVEQRLIERHSTHQAHDVYDDRDLRIHEMIARLDAISHLRHEDLSTLAKAAFVKEFGFEPEHIDLSTFVAPPLPEHRMKPKPHAIPEAELRSA